jgi:hypothetical protein
MKIPEEHIHSATTSFDYPYTEREAVFLWLVTAFSGHFLTHQWSRHVNIPRGRPQQFLVDKLTSNRHAVAYAWRSSEPGRERHRYHVKHRRLYRVFDRENSNYRKDAENHLIDVRICALDYVIDHQEANYLLTEADRIAYFREQHGLKDPDTLPHRRYAGRRQNAPAAAVYFPDRFPLGVTAAGVVFTYIDHPTDSLKPLVTHVSLYRRLFHALRTPWSFVFVSGDARKSRDAERVFRAALTRKDDIDSELLRHFTIEDRWQRKDVAGFTTADYAEMGRLRAKYSAERYRSAYEKWRSNPQASSTDQHADNTTATDGAALSKSSFEIYEPPTYRLIP